MTPRRPNNPAAWPCWATAFSEALRRRPTGVPREDYEELRSAWRALRADGVRLPTCPALPAYLQMSTDVQRSA